MPSACRYDGKILISRVLVKVSATPTGNDFRARLTPRFPSVETDAMVRIRLLPSSQDLKRIENNDGSQVLALATRVETPEGA